MPGSSLSHDELINLISVYSEFNRSEHLRGPALIPGTQSPRRCQGEPLSPTPARTTRCVSQKPKKKPFKLQNKSKKKSLASRDYTPHINIKYPFTFPNWHNSSPQRLRHRNKLKIFQLSIPPPPLPDLSLLPGTTK